MVLIVNTKNNTDALKAINIAKSAMKKTGYKTEKQKQYHIKQMRQMDNLIKGVQQLKKQGYQIKQVAFKF